MTKAEFITKVRENSELSKEKIDETLMVILNTIVDCVAASEKVGFMGFGSFEMVECKEKDGVNPKTGEKIIIAAHNKVKFAPSKQFKERVN